MQIKPAVRYHLTPTGMAIIKKKIASVGEDVEKLEHSCITDGNIKQYSHYGKQFGSFSRFKHIYPAIPVLGSIQEKGKPMSTKITCI